VTAQQRSGSRRRRRLLLLLLLLLLPDADAATRTLALPLRCCGVWWLLMVAAAGRPCALLLLHQACGDLRQAPLQHSPLGAAVPGRQDAHPAVARLLGPICVFVARSDHLWCLTRGLQARVQPEQPSTQLALEQAQGGALVAGRQPCGEQLHCLGGRAACQTCPKKRAPRRPASAQKCHLIQRRLER
jgi:hypothetical protein